VDECISCLTLKEEMILIGCERKKECSSVVCICLLSVGFSLSVRMVEFFICNLKTLMCEMYGVNMVVSWEK